LGLCCKVPDKYPYGVIVADLMRFRPNLEKVLDKYLIYAINSIVIQNQFRAITKGTTRPRVNLTIVRSIKLALAPFPEQRAIVYKIEQLFSDLDNGIENFKKAQEQLKIYRQVVLKNACEGKLVPTEAVLARAEGRDYEPADVLLARILKERREKWNGKGKYKEPASPDMSGLQELPEGWGWATLEQYAFEVKDGTHDSPKYQESGIPFVTQKNIKKNGFDFSNTNKITNEDHNKFYRRSNPESGDILISMIGANRGMSCIVNVETVFSIKNVGLVKSYKQFNIFKFIDYYMKSQVGQRLILDKSKGGAQEFIGLTELRSWPISVPPLTEQRRIVFEVERRLSICDKMEITIAESLQKSESLRQSILKKAFEGKLLNEKELEEARNAPDWEPAEKLLERIKAEKTSIKAKKKGEK